MPDILQTANLSLLQCVHFLLTATSVVQWHGQTVLDDYTGSNADVIPENITLPHLVSNTQQQEPSNEFGEPTSFD